MRSNEGCLSESVMPQKKTMATRIEAVRGLYWRAAYSMDKGKPDPSPISMAKWNAGETAVYVANEALQLHGGYGYISEYDIHPAVLSRCEDRRDLRRFERGREGCHRK